MPAYNMSQREAAAVVHLGTKVERATANNTTGLNLFTVAGGNCQINLIVGEVTTEIETKTVDYKLVSTPTVGAATDICANLDLSADEIGGLFTVEGTANTVLQRGLSGSCPGPTFPTIVAPGTIDCTVGATHTGSIKWTLWYIPLEIGASIVSA